MLVGCNAHSAILINVSPSAEPGQEGGSTVAWSGSGFAAEDVPATTVFDLPGDPISNDGPALLNVNNSDGPGELLFFRNGQELLETLQFRETDRVFIDLTGTFLGEGDEYLVSGTLSVPASVLPFDRLTPGTYVSTNASAIGGLTVVIGSDTDGDGIDDTGDNCVVAANTDQRDTNGDGIGNACDADVNDDCSVNFGDLAILKAAFFPGPYDANSDFDGDGLVNFGDLALMKSAFFNGENPGPGPSGVPNACDGG